MAMVYATICTGVFFFQLGRCESRGIWHLTMTTIGLSLLACAAATVLS